jgi:DnaJ-domain-containing protein 1
VNNKNQQLVNAVRCILEVTAEPLSEFQLLTLLKDQGWNLPTSASDSLALFTSHFLLFNALYLIQNEYWLEHRYLEISALKIVLHEATKPSETGYSSTLLLYSNSNSLRVYYLDLSELEQATSDSVNNLLSQFWGKYIADDECAAALAVFALPKATNYTEIKKTYRRLAMRSHPDRGGDAQSFQSLNHAFGVLQQLYGCQTFGESVDKY